MRETSGWAIGWTFFAMTMMILIGSFHAIVGLIAIFEDEFYVVTREYVFQLDATQWGWIHLIWGSLVAVAGGFLLTGSVLARTVGVLMAVVSAILGFAWLPSRRVGCDHHRDRGRCDLGAHRARTRHRRRGLRVMLAEWQVGQAFWAMLWFTLFFLWIWLLIAVFADIFRSHDLSGVAKALWVAFVIVAPYLGVFVYLIARGQEMGEHDAEAARAQDAAARAYIQEAAGTSTSTADELSRLADLRERGVIDEAEFQRLKANVIAPDARSVEATQM